MAFSSVDSVTQSNQTEMVSSYDTTNVEKEEEIVLFDNTETDNPSEKTKLRKKWDNYMEKSALESLLKEKKKQLEIYKQDYENDAVDGLQREIDYMDIFDKAAGSGLRFGALGLAGGLLLAIEGKTADLIANTKIAAIIWGGFTLAGALIRGIVEIFRENHSAKLIKSQHELIDNPERIEYRNNLHRKIQEQEELISMLEQELEQMKK